MSEQKYYPEDILVEKWKAVNLGGWITSTIIQLNGRKNTAAIAKKTAFPSEMNRQLSLSVIKMLNLKLRWKTEKHRKTTNKRLHTDYGDTNKYQSTGNGSAARNAKDTDA